MFSQSLKKGLWSSSRVVLHQPHRTATVLRRVHRPPVLGPYATQYQINQSVFKEIKYQRLEIVDEDDEKDSHSAPVRMILLKSMEDYGKRGQILSLPRDRAHKELLLPGLAVYASPENLNLYKDITIPEDQAQYSSDSVQKMLPQLSRLCFAIVMSQVNEWKIQPWHIRAALRQQGLIVKSDENIRLPEEVILGPNVSLEEKEFPVWITINSFEQIPLRCILFHAYESSEEGSQAQPVPPPGWKVRFYEPMFPSYKRLLTTLPRDKLDLESLAGLPDKQEIIDQYRAWRAERDKEFASS